MNPCKKAHDEQARANMPQALVSLLERRDVMALIGCPETIRERLAELEAAGVQEVILSFPDVLQLESLRFFAREFIEQTLIDPIELVTGFADLGHFDKRRADLQPCSHGQFHDCNPFHIVGEPVTSGEALAGLF